MNAPAFWTYARPAEDAPDYYTEADLDRWHNFIIEMGPKLIERSYRRTFGDSVPDLDLKVIADALHDGVQDATARFFTEINGGDL